METYTLTNGALSAQISPYGGILTSLLVPDKDGQPIDVVLGYDTLEEYENDPFYHGAIAGRFANRLADGRFTLNGKDYQLDLNNGPNHLHGGLDGFNKRLWDADYSESESAESLTLRLCSPDGDQGYPGEVLVTLTYSVPRNRNELRLDYHAVTDQPTPLNLTNHSYFNLNGADQTEDILNHVLHSPCTHYSPKNENGIPTGEAALVAGTPFDFITEKEIGQDLNHEHPQLFNGLGYDHNLILPESPQGRGPQLAATVTSPLTGIKMEALTTEAGFQLYSAYYLDGTPGKNKRPYDKGHGLCIEAQNTPNAPNLIGNPNYPRAQESILTPEKPYTQTTIYRFS